MKKTLLIVFITFFSFQGFAQDPDPELFRTWYLYYVYMDFDEPYNISEISPPIHPFITISEDLSFTGEGACNNFNGVFNISPYEINAISFNNTNDDCDIQSHNSFENDYFGFISEWFLYTINQESDGLTLYLDTPLMSGLTFKEFPLSITDNNHFKVKIYPNPTSNTLYISSENTVIETISIYSITGKKVFKSTNESNSIDVSSLSKGMYFIEISSANGKSVKKFIKK